MCLATTTTAAAAGAGFGAEAGAPPATAPSPSARFVLLKGYDERGLIWYTNYDSAKGRQLEQCSRAALAFWWEPLQRQVS